MYVQLNKFQYLGSTPPDTINNREGSELRLDAFRKVNHIAIDCVLWTTVYEFKGEGSSFIHRHTKPTSFRVTHVYDNGVEGCIISPKTGQETSKRVHLRRGDEVYIDSEECIEGYKGMLQKHIDSKLEHITKQNPDIEKLREKINALD